MQDLSNKNSHTNQSKQPSDGKKFKNVCVGIAAIGTMLLPYIEVAIKFFM